MAGSAPFVVSFSGVTKAVRAGGRGKGEEDGGGGEDVRLWLFRLRLRLRTILAAAAITSKKMKFSTIDCLCFGLRKVDMEAVVISEVK